MIFPEPRKDRLHQKGLAFLSTLVFAVLGFIFLTISDLEIKQASREVFRQIDMTSLMPRSLRLGGGVEYKSAQGQNSVQLIGPARDGNDPAQTSIADVPELEENGGDPEEASTDESESEAPQESAEQSPPEEPKSDTSPPEVQQGSEEQNSTPPPVEQPQTTSAPPPQNTTPSYSNSSDPTSSPAPLAEGGITKLSLDSFGSDYANLEVREIINWMKSNPGELPKGVRQLVRFRPAFLSSVTTSRWGRQTV